MATNNLTEPAFPCIQSDKNGVIDTVNPGFTKHEYAAIEIAKALAGNFEYLPSTEERGAIAEVAYDLAEKVLSYFK